MKKTIQYNDNIYDAVNTNKGVLEKEMILKKTFRPELLWLQTNKMSNQKKTQKYH